MPSRIGPRRSLGSVTTTTRRGPPPLAESYSGWWRVGYDNLNGWPNAPTSYFFSGTVDDAVVYSSALSGTDVLAAYRAGR